MTSGVIEAERTREAGRHAGVAAVVSRRALMAMSERAVRNLDKLAHLAAA
jgi:hypothetical protein